MRDRFQPPELAQQLPSPDQNLAKVEVAEEPEQTYNYVVDLIRRDSVIKLLELVVGEAIYIDEGGRDLVWDLVWDLEKGGENVQMTVELSRIQFWGRMQWYSAERKRLTDKVNRLVPVKDNLLKRVKTAKVECNTQREQVERSIKEGNNWRKKFKLFERSRNFQLLSEKS